MSSAAPVSILLLDDAPQPAPVLAAVLGSPGQVLVHVRTPGEALDQVRSADFALILVRVCNSGADAFDATRMIHANRRSSHTPVIVLAPAPCAAPFAAPFVPSFTETALEQAYAAGAVDVLATPPAASVLRAKAAFFIDAYRNAAERRQAQRDLHASKERYRTLFDAVDEGVCVVEVLFDADGNAHDYRFLETNPAFVLHTGLDNAIGKTCSELIPGHEQHWFDTYGRVATTGEPVRFVNEAKALDRWYDVYAARVGDAASRQVAVLFTDITERVRTESELRRLAADLSEADRRKNQFLATLAHELRNPLAPLRSGLQVMRLAAGDQATLGRVQDIMERQLGHMVTLVDDLLDVARIAHGQVELKRAPIDLNDVVRSALETSMPLIEAARHQLDLALPDRPLPLVGDPMRLTQVVSNILNNAAKYTPRGGRIRLSLGSEDGTAALAISDNGVGIPRESLHAVFDMFTQVGRNKERAQGGLGIGLSLVRSLVQLHGGTVEASSGGPGMGSTFTLRLPLQPDALRPSAAPGPAAAAEPGATLRILVVDDNRDAAETLSALLNLLGHRVMVANDGQQALQIAPGFDPELVFLDLGMPRLSGYDVARALRSDLGMRRVVLVALTGWGGESDRARTRAAGFDLHLTKPVTMAAIGDLLADPARYKGC